MGNVVKMDQAAKNKDKLAFARVMVEVGINQELPDEVTFCIEHGNVVKQKIKYEWRPSFCTKCSGYGHEAAICTKNIGTRVWIQKKKVRPDAEGFVAVGNRQVAPKQNVAVIPIHNTSTVLQGNVETLEIVEANNGDLDKGIMQGGDTNAGGSSSQDHVQTKDDGQGVTSPSHDG